MSQKISLWAHDRHAAFMKTDSVSSSWLFLDADRKGNLAAYGGKLFRSNVGRCGL
jgi:hypothetical protein